MTDEGGRQEKTCIVRDQIQLLSSFADFGGVQVLATGKSALVEIDIKYALIGTLLGVIISACFLALKICMIRRHMFDNDSSDTSTRRKSNTRDGQVIEL
ncbi:transmembrane protein 273 [Gracilinanus agilis]|uniref:transmembrane protein 273 n=1 Tax=Gracilinanus agilis TaxID=191870 RepID=UPI001CFDF35B|nr:transmembrane protein 273 [Gracilinanus agilis]